MKVTYTCYALPFLRLYTEEYSSSEESLSSNSDEEEKTSLNINNHSQLKNYKKGHVLGNGNCLFASLHKLVFNDSFGSFQLRQLIVDNIKDNKDLYGWYWRWFWWLHTEHEK